MGGKWSVNPHVLSGPVQAGLAVKDAKSTYRRQSRNDAVKTTTMRRSASGLDLVPLPGPESAYHLAKMSLTRAPKARVRQVDTKRMIPLQLPNLNYSKITWLLTGKPVTRKEVQVSSYPFTRRRHATNIEHIRRLKAILGLDGSSRHQPTTFVALDTETERRSVYHSSQVVEVGITILKSEDIKELEPGTHVMNWMSKAKHHHFVLETAVSPSTRASSSLFSQSRVLSSSLVKAEIEQLWDSLESDITLIGHSVKGDVNTLAKHLDLDLLRMRTISTIYDTYDLSTAAGAYGIELRSLTLAGVLRGLKPHPRYLSNKSLIGWHNASNDAAYSLMAALLIAVRSRDLSFAEAVTEPNNPDLVQKALQWLRRLFATLFNASEKNVRPLKFSRGS